MAPPSSPYFSLRWTPLDIPYVGLLICAIIAAYIAYDHELALDKLWTIVGSLLLSRTIATRSRQDLKQALRVLGYLGVLAVCLSIWMVVAGGWSLDNESVDQLTTAFGSLSSFPHIPYGAADILKGVLCLTLPFQFISAFLSLREHRYARSILEFGGCLLLVVGLSTFRSTTAWLALGGGLFTGLLWFGCCIASRHGKWRPRLYFSVAILTLMFITALILLRPGVLQQIEGLFIDPGASLSRITLGQQAIDLIMEVPYTGGGLNAFSGYYSRYILVTPHFYLPHSYNLFLNIAFEQGLIALILFISVYVFSGWRIVNTGEDNNNGRFDYLRAAAVMGYSVVVLSGLLSDAYFSTLASPFLFLIPGLSVALNERKEVWHWPISIRREAFITFSRSPGMRQVKVLGMVGVLTIAALLFMGGRSRSWWGSNQAVLYMARVDLRGWPAELPEYPLSPFTYGSIEEDLTLSIAYFSANYSAHYRLGLVAWGEYDFLSAEKHLQAAMDLRPGHRGIQKILGQVLVWTGDLDEAYGHLRLIPESAADMEQYEQRWNDLGRDDLATNARTMANRLKDGEP